MELITYSAENNDNFWIAIGYHICKLRIDFDRIYTNIGEYNFYETNRMRQLVFYYIQPDRILSRLITHLSRVMRRLDYNYEYIPKYIFRPFIRLYLYNNIQFYKKEKVNNK